MYVSHPYAPTSNAVGGESDSARVDHQAYIVAKLVIRVVAGVLGVICLIHGIDTVLGGANSAPPAPVSAQVELYQPGVGFVPADEWQPTAAK